MARGTVLVVERNPGAAIVARNVLGREGHHPAVAAGPHEAIEKAQADLPDLVILDVAFAEPNVLRALSAVSPVRLPILVTVPAGLADGVEAGLPQLPDVYLAGVLEKPFTPDKLRAAVRDTLLDHQSTRPLRIDSDQFGRPAPAPATTSEEVHLPTVLDPHAVQVVPWTAEPDQLEARLRRLEGTNVTFQETLDAESACELIEVAPSPSVAATVEIVANATLDADAACEVLSVGDATPPPSPELGVSPPPVPDPADPPLPDFAAAESILGGFGVSARARRLATRIRRVSGTNELDERALERACEDALESEELFGSFSTAPLGGEPLVAGKLDAVGVPQVLQLAETFGQPVSVRFERDIEAVEIVVVGRELRFARQDNLPEIFRLGRFFVELGLLAGRNLSEAIATAREEGRRIGEHLVEIDAISEADVARALARQASELVFEVVAWETGAFSIRACDPLPAEVVAAGIQLPLTGVVLDGLRRRDEWGPTVDSAAPGFH